MEFYSNYSNTTIKDLRSVIVMKMKCLYKFSLQEQTLNSEIFRAKNYNHTLQSFMYVIPFIELIHFCILSSIMHEFFVDLFWRNVFQFFGENKPLDLLSCVISKQDNPRNSGSWKMENILFVVIWDLCMWINFTAQMVAFHHETFCSNLKYVSCFETPRLLVILVSNSHTTHFFVLVNEFYFNWKDALITRLVLFWFNFCVQWIYPIQYLFCIITL